jgi:hypothetical protein
MAGKPAGMAGTAGKAAGTAVTITRAIHPTGELHHGVFDIHVPLIKMKKKQVILAQYIVLHQKKLVRPVNAISKPHISTN